MPTRTQGPGRCLLCGSDRHAPLFSDAAASGAGAGELVRCAGCGLVYRTPLPDPDAILDAYIAKPYPPPAAGWVEGRKNVFRPYLDTLARFRKTGRLLDVGAGHGFFLAACREAGWTVEGLEPSPVCRSFAERELGIRLSPDLLENAPFPDASFDLVTFWNVLDHLPDPRQALVDARRLLRPGGAVVIRSPNAAFHVPARRLLAWFDRRRPGRGRWASATIFHLYSFGPATLARLLRDNGFGSIRVSPARLSWTTSHDAAAEGSRQRAAAAIAFAAQLLHILSLKRALRSPSLLAVAVRPDTASEFRTP